MQFQCHIFFLHVLLLLIFCQASHSTEFTHDRKRISPSLMRSEHGCLQKFSVRESTIIRTADSRTMGANFLNVSDVDNREDCLSLCCQTKFCNLAVFQEKHPFPCYLFDCGPPEDFICKFSSHSYYTSAVLTINRHQLELGLWSSQHKHEAELSGLRSSSDDLSKQILSAKIEEPERSPFEVRSTERPITTSSRAPQTSPTSSVAKTEAGKKCSRFQFECHSGECIAIYNACDGIPQCKDASDEAQDLSCPQSQDRAVFNQHGNLLDYSNNNRFGSEASPDYPREDGIGYGGNGKGPGFYDYSTQQRGGQPSSASSRYEMGSGRRQRILPPVSSAIDGSDRVSGSLYPHEYPDYSLVPSPRERQQVSQVINGGGASTGQMERHQPPNLVLQNNLQLKNLPSEQKLSQHYQQQQRMDMNPMQWRDQNSRYSYSMGPKEMIPSGNQYLTHQMQSPISEQSNSNPQQMQGNRFNQESNLRKYGQANSQGHLQIQTNLNNQQLMQNNPSINQGINRNNPSINQGINGNNPSSNQGIHGNNPSINQAGEIIAQKQANPENPIAINKSQPTTTSKDKINSSDKNNVKKKEETKNSSSSSASVAKSEKQESIKKEENNSKNKTSISSGTKSLVAHASISRLEVDLKELEAEAELQQSETSGAIFALSLGIIVTGLMIVLVVFRIRGLKRRGAHRRRTGLKSPLEHDADYLVNGMYL